MLLVNKELNEEQTLKSQKLLSQLRQMMMPLLWFFGFCLSCQSMTRIDFVNFSVFQQNSISGMDQKQTLHIF